MNNLIKILLVSRPISWLNTAYPFAATFFVIGGHPTLFFAITTLYFLFPYNLLMYGINDIFDFESDMKNPRKGGIEGGKEQKAFHPKIVASIALTNIPLIAYIMYNGAAVSNLLFVILLFFVVAYSLDGFRFKEIPILDSLTSSIHFVGPMVFAMSLVGFETSYTPYIIAFILWGMASHAFGAVQDIVPDRQASINSVATVLGAKKTMYCVILFYALASFIVMLQGPSSLIVGLAGLIYVFNTLPFRVITDNKSMRANKGWRRFIWLNMFTGFVITIVLILNFL